MLPPRANLLLCALWAAGSRAAPLQGGGGDPFAILDAQNWVNPDDMTWDDYVYPPDTKWNDPSRTGSIRNFKIALVLVDYPDLNFTVTEAPNATFWGNPLPIVANLAREDVPSYYHDLLNVPQDLNHGHTLHEYWMEDSGGRYGVELSAYGAYRLPSKSFQYGIDDEEGGFNPGACPEEPCSVDLRTDALGAWRREVGNATADSFELAFILSAGQDESATWQEFGEMKFATKEDVPDVFGPPGNSSLPNYAKTRYVEWSSWASASCIWPNAGGGSSTQAESSGAATFAHELSHLLGIGDNYNNPFSVPARRAYTGPWSMMSRGSFNGPGGPHTRWQIPALKGASLGSEHTVRDKLQLGLTANTSVLSVPRAQLAPLGTVVAEITARSVDVSATGGLKGLRVLLDADGGDKSPACNINTDPLCDGGGFNFYDAEVIDRMGADSFTPDAGVLFSKGKTSDARQPFQWVIDANPQDIRVIDFVLPNGTDRYLTIGDYRQLADALFHAGSRSGSTAVLRDDANGLVFYVVDPHRSESGVLSYTVGVKALSDDVEFGSTYGVKLGAGKVGKGDVAGKGVACTFTLKNTGTYGGDAPAGVDEKYLQSDIYRLSATVEESGWEVVLPNELATAKFGEKTKVKVAVKREADAASQAVVKLLATSESDGEVTGEAECRVGGY